MAFMLDENSMRVQKETFREKLSIMQRRVQKREEKAPVKSQGCMKEEKVTGKDSYRKDRDGREEKKGGGKGHNKNDKQIIMQDIKEEVKDMCMAFMGASLRAKDAKGDSFQCRQRDCWFLHKKASELTLLEAEKAMEKAKESFEQRAIQKAVNEFKNFLK
jgi:hypothetical protein